MGVALVTVFADEAGEVEVAGGELEAGFLKRFPASAGVGGFAFVGAQFPTAWTPEAAIGFLSAFEQKDFVLLVKAVEQGGDFVGQLHRASESGADEWRKNLRVGRGRVRSVCRSCLHLLRLVFDTVALRQIRRFLKLLAGCIDLVWMGR